MPEPIEVPENSILKSVKKALGLEPEYTHFDPELIMFINSTFGTLHQLGVGPDVGYTIEDARGTWDDFLKYTTNLQSVQTYMYLKVRLLFDPPTTSFAIQAMEKMATEMEWRLNVASEGVKRPWPTPVPIAN